MATTSDDRAATDVEFALERFSAEHGRLVVEGRWHGVAGRRFLRPLLQLEGRRRVIAVLDHKPWAAEEGALWKAAFPHEGEAGPALLQVAPDISVQLPAPGGVPAGRFPRATRARAMREGSAGADARDELARARVERDEARREADRLRAERVEAGAALDRARAERDEARAEADRLRGERDDAVAKCEQARVTATAAQGDAERLRDDLDRARAEARASVGRALAERDAARGDLDRLRSAPAAGPPQPHVPFRFDVPARRDTSWAVRGLAVVAVASLLFVLVRLLGVLL